MPDASRLPVSPESADKESSYFVVEAGLPMQVFVVGDGVSVLGRGADSTIRISHPSVSRKHCWLIREGSMCRVKDLASRLGTKVNGAACGDTSELKPGDLLQLGPVQLRYNVGVLPDLPRVQPSVSVDAENIGSAAKPASEPATMLPPHPPMVIQGRPASEIDLSRSPLTIGRDLNCDVVLNNPEVSRQQARIEVDPEGFRIRDISARGGCRINGRHFDQHVLVYGDQLDVGPLHFRFDGRVLQLLQASAGGWISAIGLSKQAGGRTILEEVSLSIEPGQFCGILGPSGAGKSTLLGALTGLRPPDRGKVLMNGANLYAYFERLSSGFGWVPQEDIVHQELTVAEALAFAARLRLPRDTPRSEIVKLIERTAWELGLEQRLDVQVGRLSGGQIKRVSVGVELLHRPRILFLDEPTSGLDPAAEFKLMELLRHLADTGCTVVCTTHVMENVFLMDQVLVLAQGSLVFAGNAEETREFFGVRRMTALYDRLDEFPAREWRARFEGGKKPGPPPVEIDAPAPAVQPAKRALQFPLLIQRQWTILQADWRNFAILFGQPLLIGLLLAWAAEGSSLKLFFAYIGTLWLGCTNGAQEIVSEVPIYRRERIVGLKRSAYLLSKIAFIGALTILQSALLYLVAQLAAGGIEGSALWQIAALAAIALVGSATGLAISALVRSPMQAVLLVPLVIIPQILLSGYTVPAMDMRPSVLAVSRMVPSFNAQTLMDVSVLWNKELSRDTISEQPISVANLKKLAKVETGEIFRRWEPGVVALVVELGWLIAANAVSWFALRKKERN